MPTPPTDITTSIQVINTTYDATPANIGKVYVGIDDTPPWARAYPNLAKDSCDLANGNTFTNSGKEFVLIVNNGAVSLGVDVDDQSECDHGFTHDPIAAVPAGDTIMLGPFPVEWFTRTCGISYTGGTGGTAPKISVFQLPSRSPTPE